jgi:hypothetical protein
LENLLMIAFYVNDNADALPLRKKLIEVMEIHAAFQST